MQNLDNIEFVCKPVKFAPSASLEVVTVMVYKNNDDAEPGISNLPPRIEALFSLKPFEDKYMAFIELYDTIHNDILGYGNSLHGIGSLPYEDLKSKITSYTYLSEIKKDFDIIQ